MDQVHLGHKLPRPGYSRLGGAFITAWLNKLKGWFGALHVMGPDWLQGMFCKTVWPWRTPEWGRGSGPPSHTWVLALVILVFRGFLHACERGGLSSSAAYRHYVIGLDVSGSKIDTDKHLLRGASLSRLTDEWLDIWESIMEWISYTTGWLFWLIPQLGHG